jgi:hypothetical protein
MAVLILKYLATIFGYSPRYINIELTVLVAYITKSTGRQHTPINFDWLKYIN